MVDESERSSQNEGSSDSKGITDKNALNPNISIPFLDKVKNTFSKLPPTLDRKILKDKIKEMVDVSNDLLGNLEEKYHSTNHWVDTNIRPIILKTQEMSHTTKEIYEQRRTYGPQIIGASIGTTALLMVVKTRGRIIPSLLFSGFVGGVVYSGIYGLPPIFDNVIQYRIHKRNDE